MSTRTRRALLVLPWLDVGGADTFNLDLTERLTRQLGWQVSLALTMPSEHPWRARFERHTDDIALLHALAPQDQPDALLELVRSRAPDALILSHSQLGYDLLPLLRQRLPGLAILDFLHMEDEQQGGGYPATSLAAARWLDMTAVSSEHLRGWMLARGGDPARVAVCHTNIDSDTWDPARHDRAALRRALGLGDSPAILYAARLAPQKQPRLLAQLARELARRGLPFTLLVAGDGPERAWLERFVARERLGQVRLLGAQSAEQVRELMAASDIFLLPSRHEGISLALYEAMAMGLPAVAADVGGQRELLTPACGELVRRGPGERDAYVEALDRLIRRPALRAEQGAAARRRVAEHFRIEQLGARMAEVIARAEALAAAEPRGATPSEAEAARAKAVRAAEEIVNARRLWGYEEARPSPALAAVRYTKGVLQPAFRWAMARDERVARLAVGARNVIARLLLRR